MPLPRFSLLPRFPRLGILVAALLVVGIVACAPTVGLAPGLVARMDAPGAKLDAGLALGLINDLRSRSGAPALTHDPALEAAAKEAALAYAGSGRSPRRPDAAAMMMTSAGYVTFAETFSGWRGSSTDTRTLSDPALTRAGLAVANDGNTEFGTYWVLLAAR